MNHKVTLGDLRLELDNIDQEVVKLLVKRFHITDEIGAIKSEQGMSIYDESREKVIYDKIRQICYETLSEDDDISEIIVDIYTLIMLNSRKRQELLR